MRFIIGLSFLGVSSMSLFAPGCAMNAESDADSIGQVTEALSESSAKPPLAVDRGAALESTALAQLATTVSAVCGGALFQTISNLGQNCRLTASTTGATNATDPVMGIVINNGNGHPWGSSTQPCHHGSPFTQVDGYNTLALNDDTVGRNPRVTWKNPNGGAALSVQLVGFLFPSSTFTPGTLPVRYTVTECNDSTQNRDVTIQTAFGAKGVLASLPGNVVTVAGAAPGCTDPVLYELDTNLGGNAKCNDDCSSGSTRQSCIPNNSGASMWYFSPNFFANGNLDIHN